MAIKYKIEKHAVAFPSKLLRMVASISTMWNLPLLPTTEI